MKTKIKTYIILLFTALTLASCSSDDNVSQNDISNADKLKGTWIRKGDDGSLIVVYSFRDNSVLFRANSTDLHLARFGSYAVENDIINFIDSPENYTPVRFEIKSELYNGVNQDILYLFDADTDTPYGFYTRITNDQLEQDYDVTIDNE